MSSKSIHHTSNKKFSDLMQLSKQHHQIKICEASHFCIILELVACKLIFFVKTNRYLSRGVHSQEMPGTEVPLGWVAIFELRYRDGSRFLPFGIRMVPISAIRYKNRYRFSNSGP